MNWKIEGKPESGGTSGYVVCPNCGGKVFAIWLAPSYWEDNSKYRFKYCPYCGKRMEGE